MRTLLLLGIHLCLILQLRSQTVCESNQLLMQAEIYYRQDTNLSQAVALYKAGFEKNIKNVSKVLDALEVATHINDAFSAKEFLRLAFAMGITPTDINKFWTRWKTDMDLDVLIADIDTAGIRNRYESGLDTSLVNKLYQMALNDQKYRGAEDGNLELQKSLDKKNGTALKTMVQQKNRLPYYKEIGMDGLDNLELLFHHMDKEVIDWLIPYALQLVREGEYNLGPTILYQLERIGMSDGLIYSITDQGEIIVLTRRTKMKNGFYCQSFGEWFYEKSSTNNKRYETPIDPNINLDEVNRVRNLFCMGTIENKRRRQPWINVVSINAFENLIQE